MAKLGVNIDHVATIREVRKATYPDPVYAALEAERGGADNITCHLREDRRHVQERDVKLLKEMIRTELNLEMAATQEMTRFALELKPETVTLVPERREELTTEGGIDLVHTGDQLPRTIMSLKEAGIAVSLFIDPEIDSVKMAHRLGANAVELHTGTYALAERKGEKERELLRILESAQFANKLKLEVHAGHGLNEQNIASLVKMGQFHSFQVGHAIVGNALIVGMERSVRQVKRLIDTNR